MAERGLGLALEFRDDALSQYFAQLHAPLVEGVDVPDNTLGEDRVLVESDQRAERMRRFIADFGWQGKSFIISALKGEGCNELKYAIMEYLDQSIELLTAQDTTAAEEKPEQA